MIPGEFMLCLFPLQDSGKTGVKGTSTRPAASTDRSEASSGKAEAAPAITGFTMARQVLQSSEPAAEVWDKLFRQHEISPDTLADAVTWLHVRRQYEPAIEAMQSAIRNDAAAPWIYDVLALEMKLAGRPAKDIARVMESRVDFSYTDVRQMLITAALMSRFDAWNEAAALCREATKLAPLAPEPWLLGRSVSDKSGDLDTIVFFRCGILKNVWTPDYETHHQEAVKSLRELAERLDQTGRSPEAATVREQLADASARDLVINLTWVGPADLDLMVKGPDGERCSYRNRVTSGGGYLVKDGRPGDSPSEKHRETYVCPTGLSGEYEVTVRFVLGRAATGMAVLELITHAGTPQENKTTRTVSLSGDDVKHTITLTGGRRKSIDLKTP